MPAKPDVLPIVLDDGPSFVTPAYPGEAQRVAEIFAVQWRYVHGDADPAELRQYRGQRIAGRLVETDPDVLDEYARRGEFDLAEVYRELFS